MNINFFLSCKICTSIVNIKYQAGYYNWTPFTYECPTCKVICKGELYIKSQISPIGKDSNLPLSNLKNCEEVSKKAGTPIVGMIQLASELFTNKFNLKSKVATPGIPSPFMEYVILGVDTEELQKLVYKLLSTIYSREEKYTAFWNLYEHSSSYLYREKKKNNIKNIKQKEHNESQKISFLQNFLYEDVRKSNYYQQLKNDAFTKLIFIRKKKYSECKKLIDIIESNFPKNSKKIFTVTSNFLKYYNYILPIILNGLVGALKIDDIKTQKGIAQTDFEELKHYFAENYEDLKDLIIILILINNIFYRGRINLFHEKFYSEFKKDAPDLENNVSNFNNKIRNVGNRIKILNYDSGVHQIVNNVFDNNIRNSIDHRDYSYEYNQQLITFINKSKKREMFLIEFGDYLFQGFLLANLFWDMIMYISEEGKILIK